jgi:hypothetical protein
MFRIFIDRSSGHISRRRQTVHPPTLKYKRQARQNIYIQSQPYGTWSPQKQDITQSTRITVQRSKNL